MSTPGDDKTQPLKFNDLIDSYNKLQQNLVRRIRALASKMDETSPGAFLLLQMQMSQVAQIGDSISNLIAQANSIVRNSIQNQQK